MISLKSFVSGILGGLAGGVVFGIMMAMGGSMPMIAKMVGSDSAAVGWIIHFIISATIGFFYAWWFGKKVTSHMRGLSFGMLHGFIWWILGPLVIMPLMLGMGVQFANAFTKMNMMSLMGHLIYGIILGLVYFSILELRKWNN